MKNTMVLIQLKPDLVTSAKSICEVANAIPAQS
jgi:hypothetical protein